MRVQWLGIRLAVGATGSILGQGTKIQNATQHDQKRWGGEREKIIIQKDLYSRIGCETLMFPAP